MKYLSHRLSAAMWSRVLLLWITLTVGALAIGGVALWLGGFIQSNTRDELASQQITFTAADKLSDEEKQIPGMVENAGLPLTTGNQAQVYANLMALHLREAADGAGYPGATYATLGAIQRELRAKVTAATDAKDQAAIDAAQTELTAVNNLRNTMLTGSTLRGTLLSAYGWDNVATGITAAGVVVMVLGLVFLVLFVYELRRGHLPPTEA
ncbi:MAG: hypothetical protein KF726_12610 [Anaerolineae bacterium]|nr:hypothetical protein [Anaerolineae bacterium]